MLSENITDDTPYMRSPTYRHGFTVVDTKPKHSDVLSILLQSDPQHCDVAANSSQIKSSQRGFKPETSNLWRMSFTTTLSMWRSKMQKLKT